MQIPDLLEQLGHLENKKEQEADKYIKEIQRYVKSQSGKKWTPQHEAVFLLLQKRVASAELYKRLFVGVSIVMLLAGLFIGARWYYSWEDYLTNTALMEMARSSTLPLRLQQAEQSGEYLIVKISEDYPDMDAPRQDRMSSLLKRLPTLGRHYSLGENATLLPEFLPRQSKLLLRESVNRTPLGKIDIKENSGSIWPATGINAPLARQQFKLGEPIQFRKDDQPVPFYLAVIGIEKDMWEVRFSEDGRLWSKSFFLNKTNRGDIEGPPYLVYEQGWKRYTLWLWASANTGRKTESGMLAGEEFCKECGVWGVGFNLD